MRSIGTEDTARIVETWRRDSHVLRPTRPAPGTLSARPMVGEAGEPDALWLWNGTPTAEVIDRQLAAARALGYGTLAVWPWAGLELPLPDEAYLGALATACDAARAHGVGLWLAGDVHWPSGTAGGRLLVERPELAQRALACWSRWAASGQPLTLTWRGEGEQLVTALALDDAGQRRQLEAQIESGGRSHHERHTARYGGYRATWETRVWDVELRLPPGDWFVTVATVVRTQPLLPAAVGCAWSPVATGAPDPLNPRAVQAYAARALEPLARAAGRHAGETVLGIVVVPPEPLYPYAPPAAGSWRVDVLPWPPDAAELFERLFERQLATHLPYALAPLHERPPAESAPLDRWHAVTNEQAAQTFTGTLERWCAARGLALLPFGPATLERLPQAPLTLRAERKRAVDPRRVVTLAAGAGSAPGTGPLSSGHSPALARTTAAPGEARALPARPTSRTARPTSRTLERPESHDPAADGWQPLAVLGPDWEWLPASANWLPLGEWSEWKQGTRAGARGTRFEARCGFEADHVPERVWLVYEAGIVESVALNGAPVPLAGSARPEPGLVELADDCHRVVPLRSDALRFGANTVRAVARLGAADQVLLDGAATAGPLALVGHFALRPGTAASRRGPARWRLVRQATFATLGSWADAGFPRYAGTATCAQTVRIAALPPGTETRLVARAAPGHVGLTVDGRPAHEVCSEPWVFDLGGVVREGLNRIEVTYATSVGPRLAAGMSGALHAVTLEYKVRG
jgi:hypothetical protein